MEPAHDAPSTRTTPEGDGTAGIPFGSLSTFGVDAPSRPSLVFREPSRGDTKLDTRGGGAPRGGSTSTGTMRFYTEEEKSSHRSTRADTASRAHVTHTSSSGARAAPHSVPPTAHRGAEGEASVLLQLAIVALFKVCAQFAHVFGVVKSSIN